MNKIYIIRFSSEIKFPSGTRSNMTCRSGTHEEVKEYAERMAREHGLTVEMIE